MTLSALPVLTFLVWTPAVGALLALALKNERASLRRSIAIGAALVALALALAAFAFLELGPGSPYREIVPWIPPLGASYELALDPFGSVFTLWVALLVPLVLFSERPEPLDRVTAALLLFGETALLGLFVSGDFILFFSFYGGGLLALSLLHRRPGAMKSFFVYQTAALALQGGLLLACFHLAWSETGFPSAEIARLSSLVTYPDLQSDLFLLGAVAFAFAAPLFPLAAWLKESEESLSAPSLTFLLGGWSLAPASFLVRIVLPAFPLGASEAGGVVSLFAALSLPVAGLVPYRGTKERSFLPALAGLQALSLLGLLSTRSEGVLAGRMGLLELGLGMTALALWTAGAGSTEGLPLTRASRMSALGVVLAVLYLPGESGLPVWWNVLASSWERSPGVALVAGAGLVLIGLRLLFQVPALARAFHRNRRARLLLLLPLFAWWLLLAGSRPVTARLAPASPPAKPGILDEEER
jgi:NADH-quinone oxidoreductase subunit M